MQVFVSRFSHSHAYSWLGTSPASRVGQLSKTGACRPLFTDGIGGTCPVTGLDRGEPVAAESLPHGSM